MRKCTCGDELPEAKILYCSVRCKHKAHRDRMRLKYVPVKQEVTCKLETCDNVFEVNKAKKFCSDECYAKHKAILGKAKARKQQVIYKLEKPVKVKRNTNLYMGHLNQ